jgi:glycosyltransferase involved in cell wall biosynthesis
MISVIVYTRDEARNIRACLETVAWSPDVHVVDSHSTDDTVDIARGMGVTVTVRSYTNESDHKNWALRHLPLRYDWVFQIDADERCTPDLAVAMRQAVTCPGSFVAYRFVRRDFLRGTWIRHTQPQPYSLRLFRRDRIHYDRIINPVCVVDGPVGELGGYLDHYPFSKGVDQWLERHNRYSAMEARQIVVNRQAGVGFSWWKAFTERDFHARRYHQKELFYRLPLRPLLKFLLLYVGKGGFLDGRAGLQYSILQSMYEYMIVIKTQELMDVDAAIPAVHQPVQHRAQRLRRRVQGLTRPRGGV